MGDPNNVLKVYMKRPDRIRSVLEYYLGGELPQDWVVEAADGFYTLINSKGKISFRERDNISRIRADGYSFCLGLENQDAINLRENPLSLKDMVDMEKIPGKLQRHFADYKVDIIHMRSIPEEDLQKMDSDLKYVLGIMKCTDSRKKYAEYIRKNKDYFSKIPWSAVDIINVCTNIKNITKYLEFTATREDEEETADKCKALVEIERNAIRKGHKQGVKEGQKQGIQQGIQLAQLLLADGRQEDLLRSATDALFRKKLLKEYRI